MLTTPQRCPLLALVILCCWTVIISARRECEPLSVSVCTGYGYSSTIIDREAQKLAQSSIIQLMSLGDDCDESLRPFLCYSFAPKCRKKYDYGIVPCRSVCKKIKRRCRAAFSTLDNLPAQIDCDNEDLFPRDKRPGGCISEKKLQRYALTTGAKPTTVKPMSNTSTTRAVTVSATTQLNTPLPQLTTRRHRGGRTRYTTLTQTTAPPITTRTPTKISTTLPPTTQTSTTAINTPAAKTTPRTKPATPTTKRARVGETVWTKRIKVTQSQTRATTTPRTPSPTTSTTPATKIPSYTEPTTVQPAMPTTERARGGETVWTKRIRITQPQTHATTTPQTSPPTTTKPATTQRTVKPFKGPVFNPFYPPEFGRVDDPRKRKTMLHRNISTTKSPSTTTRTVTTTLPPLNTTLNITENVTVDRNWLLKQLNETLQYVQDRSSDQYTKDWDLSNYSKIIAKIEEKLSATTPWYQQDYSLLWSKVDWSKLTVRDENGTDITSSLDEEERRAVYEQIFDLPASEDDPGTEVKLEMSVSRQSREIGEDTSQLSAVAERAPELSP